MLIFSFDQVCQWRVFLHAIIVRSDAEIEGWLSQTLKKTLNTNPTLFIYNGQTSKTRFYKLPAAAKVFLGLK